MIKELLAYSVYVQQQVQLDNLCFKKANKTMFGTILSGVQVILSILASAVSDHCALFCTSSSLVHYYTRTAFSS